MKGYGLYIAVGGLVVIGAGAQIAVEALRRALWQKLRNGAFSPSALKEYIYAALSVLVFTFAGAQLMWVGLAG